jgi:SAM-dependent methyltransferase
MGIDSSQDHVEFCRALGLDARLADANAAIPAPDGAFDFVWVSDVIEHLDAPRLLLRAAAPKLKPDGRLLLFLTLLPRVRLARKLLRVRGIRRFDADAHHYQFTIDTGVPHGRTRRLLHRVDLRSHEGGLASPWNHTARLHRGTS